jgi:hypothetical protein
MIPIAQKLSENIKGYIQMIWGIKPKLISPISADSSF